MNDPMDNHYPDKLVKCGCGMPMRQRNWLDHFLFCKVAKPVETTEQDESDLLAYENHHRQQEEVYQKLSQQQTLKFQEWLKTLGKPQ